MSKAEFPQRCPSCAARRVDGPWTSPNGGRTYAARVYHHAGCVAYLQTPRRHDDEVAHLVEIVPGVPGRAVA